MGWRDLRRGWWCNHDALESELAFSLVMVSLDGDVLLHCQRPILIPEEPEHSTGISHRLKSQEVLDESIDLSRDR
jgi:hypothetical protein